MSRMGEFWERLICVFLPDRCIFCNTVIEPLTLCCDECRDELHTVRPPVCAYCGRSRTDCVCKQHRHSYEAVVAPFYYSGAARQGVRRLKRWDDPKAIRFFASQMAAVVRREFPDLDFDGVCGVPMTDKDVRRRGYNQSELLAKTVAEILGLPLCPVLVKRYQTVPQKALKRTERSGNVLGVFDVTELLPGRRMLLVDDLVTTGSTVGECAKMLKLAGAKTVTVVAIAVSAPQPPGEPVPGETVSS